MSGLNFVYNMFFREDLETAESIVSYFHDGTHLGNEPLVVALAQRMSNFGSADEMCAQLPEIAEGRYDRYVGPSECCDIVEYVLSDDCVEFEAWGAPISIAQDLRRKAAENSVKKDSPND